MTPGAGPASQLVAEARWVTWGSRGGSRKELLCPPDPEPSGWRGDLGRPGLAGPWGGQAPCCALESGGQPGLDQLLDTRAGDQSLPQAPAGPAALPEAAPPPLGPGQGRRQARPHPRAPRAVGRQERGGAQVVPTVPAPRAANSPAWDAPPTGTATGSRAAGCGRGEKTLLPAVKALPCFPLAARGTCGYPAITTGSKVTQPRRKATASTPQPDAREPFLEAGAHPTRGPGRRLGQATPLMLGPSVSPRRAAPSKRTHSSSGHSSRSSPGTKT